MFSGSCAALTSGVDVAPADDARERVSVGHGHVGLGEVEHPVDGQVVLLRQLLHLIRHKITQVC